MSADRAACRADTAVAVLIAVRAAVTDRAVIMASSMTAVAARVVVRAAAAVVCTTMAAANTVAQTAVVAPPLVAHFDFCFPSISIGTEMPIVGELLLILLLNHRVYFTPQENCIISDSGLYIAL